MGSLNGSSGSYQVPEPNLNEKNEVSFASEANFECDFSDSG